MAKMKPEVIVLKGEPLIKEGLASTAIYPGHLVEFGGTADLRHHSDAAKTSARKAFALENDLFGKEITDELPEGDNVVYALFKSGEEVNAVLAGNADAITKGDALASAGDGTLKKHSGTSAVIGFALVSVDNSANADKVFIAVEVA